MSNNNNSNHSSGASFVIESFSECMSCHQQKALLKAPNDPNVASLCADCLSKKDVVKKKTHGSVTGSNSEIKQVVTPLNAKSGTRTSYSSPHPAKRTWREPSYQEWPRITEELLERVRQDLKQNLSSVLNNPEDLAPTLPPTGSSNDLQALTLNPEIEEFEQISFEKDFAPFYSKLEGLFKVFFAGRAVSDGDFDEENQVPFSNVPEEYMRERFQLRDICGEFDVLNPLFIQKLSHYLDIVEMELVKATSKRAKEFFFALVEIRTLSDHIASSVLKIKDIRKRVEQVQGSYISSGICIPFLLKRQENMRQMMTCLALVKAKREAMVEIDSLIETDRIMEALRVLESEEEQLQQWRGIRSFEEEMEEFKRNKMLVIEEKVVQMVSRLLFFDEERDQMELRTSLYPLCEIIVKMKVAEAVVKAVFDRSVQEAKLMEVDDNFSRFTRLLMRFETLVELVESLEECIVWEDNFKKMLRKELDHLLAAWLRGKYESILEMRYADFAALCHKCAQFSEQLGSFALKNEMVNQSKTFASHFHKARSSKLNKYLEEERWNVTEVDHDVQQLVDSLCSVKKDVATATENSPAQHSNVLMIKGRGFKVVRGCLELIRLVNEYVCCSSSIPFAAPELLTDLLRLLKAFNSKCALLILGAQAMQSAKLKAISTKHIVLCHESISAIVAIIPSVCEKMSCNYAEDDLSERFRVVRSEMEDHRRDLGAKIVSIMRDMITGHLDDFVLEGVIEKTQVLHRLVAQILQKNDVECMFQAISQMYIEKLKEHLACNSTNFESRDSRIELRTKMQHFCDEMGKFTLSLWESFMRDVVEKDFDPENGSVNVAEESPRPTTTSIAPTAPATATDKTSNFFHKLRFGTN